MSYTLALPAYMTSVASFSLDMHAQDEQVILCLVQKQHSATTHCSMALHMHYTTRDSVLVVIRFCYHVRPVSQSATSQASDETCSSQHLQCMLLSHKLLVAGTRSVGMMFRAVVFTFMPTAIELILVCTLLAQRFRPAVALAVLVTFVAYVWWTTVMTKVCLVAAAISPCSCVALTFLHCDASWLPVVRVVLVVAL